MELNAENYEALTASFLNRQNLDAMDEWHKRRFAGIGGSEVATVLGLNPYQTKKSLWDVKTGRTVAFAGNNNTYWGHVLESVVADEYAKLTGNKVRVTNKHYNGAKIDAPWLVGNIDRLIVGTTEKETRILECKTCTDEYRQDSDGEREWGPGNLYDKDGKCVKEDDHVPVNYLLQVQHYMAICDKQETDLAVLFMRTREFRIYTIHRNEPIIKAIVDQTRAFWNCVVNDIEPALTQKEMVEVINHSDVDLNSVQADFEIRQKVDKLKELKAKKTELEKEIDLLQDDIKLFMGDKAKLESVDGKVLATFTSGALRQTFDQARFKTEHPEMFGQYMKESRTARILRLK